MRNLALYVFAFAYIGLEERSPAAFTEYSYCPPNVCDMHCDHGFKTDDNGCDVCSCRDKACKTSHCSIVCMSGFKRDENGCTICECRSDETIVKPGQCPTLPEYSQPFGCTDVLELNDCRGDQDCSGERKCCEDICRDKCMDPA